MTRPLLSNLLGLAGAVLGAGLGILAARWISTQGFYAPIVPGGGVGLGCGLLARHRSTARGFACAAIGLIAGVISEYVLFRFRWNPSDEFLDYLMKVYKLPLLTWLFLGLGAVIAFWIGRDHLFGVAYQTRDRAGGS